MITSKQTARKQVPALFKQVQKGFGWDLHSINLDIGGGPWEDFTDKLRELGVTNYVYDPYNRSEEHNAGVIFDIEHDNCPDTVTLANVLNVIETKDGRIEALKMAKKYCKDGGRVFITVYEGNKSGQGCETRDGWQEHRKIDSYESEIAQVFHDFHRTGNMWVVWV